METFVKLIHQANMTFLPTKLPVQFYGLPDGKVYLIFSRFYGVKYNRTDVEYVLAEHKEFSFDYEKNRLIPLNSSRKNTPVYNEMVDKPDPKIKILKIYRNFTSLGQASILLNEKAKKMLEHIDDQEKSTVCEISSDSKELASA
ncbi:hypothetical protein SAMN05444274_10425 [Mariniphaga anaerophila]|uniref:Uncharacterized protein n=1 Tax=Mariniphaga anaerophila TaxID=1484053 RepID=A0A1M4ZQ07_9BACT|nr:hypothetical protein [Mariniphaga anaerophila]SHF20190.1 hypothetical protein SAMN05444274_10425 [Mariniphaga anaerophila]